MAEPPAEPAAKKPCVKPGGKSMSSSKTKKKGGIWEHYEETTETGQRGGPQVKCTHCKANMNPNVTTIMTPHTATCSAAPSEVRKRFGGTGTVAERDHPAPSAGDHGAAAKAPLHRPTTTIAGMKPLTSQFKRMPTWSCDIDLLRRDIAEAVYEATGSFAMVELPKFRQAFKRASGFNLTDNDLPNSAYVGNMGIVKSFASEMLDTHEGCRNSRKYSLTGMVDLWSNAARKEMCSVGVAGIPGRSKVSLLGSIAMRDKVHHGKVKAVAKQLFADHAGEDKVGFICRDRGSNVRVGMDAYCDDQQKVGRPVFPHDCSLHDVTNLGEDIAKVESLQPTIMLCQRIASCVRKDRRVRDHVEQKLSGRMKKVVMPFSDEVGKIWM